MIANFTLMGALYKHREYDTLATAWNTYPWVLGADNPIEQSIELDDFYSTKTIWESGQDNLAELLGFSLESFSMTAVLIRIDNLGNFGKAASNPPNLTTPPKSEVSTIGITGVSLTLTATETLVVRDSNSENKPQGTIGITGVSLTLTVENM